MAGRFKHEDVAAVPRGYRVRTIKRGEHEIRVAFPPGRRRPGAGRVVSILHPVGENPSCPIRNIAANLANPEPCKCVSGEPATFGGMCSRCARAKAAEARARAGQIRASAFNGKKKSNPSEKQIRAGARPAKESGRWVFSVANGARYERDFPTKRDARAFAKQLAKESGRSVHYLSPRNAPYVVRNPDSHRISWSDEMVRRLVAAYQGWRRAGMGHREALDRTIKDTTAGKGAIEEFKRRISRPGFGNNPKRRRRNPDGELDQAADLYREFHGREPHEILELQESELARKDYTALGDAIVLRFVLPDERILVITFSETDKVLVVSSPDGRQLYLLGGDQDIAGALADYNVDVSKDLIDLGDAVFISYDASKWQTDFKPTIWEHKLGEESGIHPRGFFDKFKRRIFFAGGNYRVERPGIID